MQRRVQTRPRRFEPRLRATHEPAQRRRPWTPARSRPSRSCRRAGSEPRLAQVRVGAAIGIGAVVGLALGILGARPSKPAIVCHWALVGRCSIRRCSRASSNAARESRAGVIFHSGGSCSFTGRSDRPVGRETPGPVVALAEHLLCLLSTRSAGPGVTAPGPTRFRAGRGWTCVSRGALSLNAGAARTWRGKDLRWSPASAAPKPRWQGPRSWGLRGR